VVKCQATRSRSQNQKIALRLLAEKVELLEKGNQSRVAVIAEATKKKKASRMKKSRRKYRTLDEVRRLRKDGLGGAGKEDNHGKSDGDERDMVHSCGSVDN
jgi:protein subunit release factor B